MWWADVGSNGRQSHVYLVKSLGSLSVSIGFDGGSVVYLVKSLGFRLDCLSGSSPLSVPSLSLFSGERPYLKCGGGWKDMAGMVVVWLAVGVWVGCG